jgi:hypothetical protein
MTTKHKARVDRLEAQRIAALDAAIEAEIARVGPDAAECIMREVAAEFGLPWDDDDA